MTKPKADHELLRARNGQTNGRAKPHQAKVRVDNATYCIGWFTTKEEAKQAADTFREQGRQPNVVLARCYCMRRAYWIPQSWVQKFTRSCGAEDCRHPLMDRAS